MRKTAIVVLPWVLLAVLAGSSNSQTRDIKIEQGKCNVSIVNTGSGDQKVQIESGICGDPTDSSKALRLKYVWLDSASISVLLAGKVGGDLARSVGSRPYIMRNRVYDQISQIIERFGSNLGEPGLVGSTVFTEIEGKMTEGRFNSSSSQQDFNSYRKRIGKTKIYNAEESVMLPDADAHLAIQNTNEFPANYAMYYQLNEVDSNTEPSQILQATVLWRRITSDDLKNYAEHLAKFRDLVLKKTLKTSINDTTKRAATNLTTNALSNRTISAMRYFSREGLPDDFLFAIANAVKCGDEQDYPDITLEPRKLYVQVAVIENVEGKGVVRISSVAADQVDSNQLRAFETDTNWKPIELSFPAGALQSNETLVIPLHIELRPDEPVQDAGLAALNGIRTYPKPIVANDQKGRTLYRKTREAFRSPTIPETRTYTYGPHLRLVAVVADGKQIALRQYDPSKASMRFGFLEGSCPAVYVQPVDGSPRISYGRILRGAVGKDRMRTDILWHDGPAQFIELVEDEPEITRLQSLKTFVVDANGNEKLVDSKYTEFIIPGSPVRVESPELLRAAKIRVEVQGYYKSLPRMLLEQVTLKDM